MNFMFYNSICLLKEQEDLLLHTSDNPFILNYKNADSLKGKNEFNYLYQPSAI